MYDEYEYEDEKHVVFECKLYDTCRAKYAWLFFTANNVKEFLENKDKNMQATVFWSIQKKHKEKANAFWRIQKKHKEKANVFWRIQKKHKEKGLIC